MAPPIDYVRYVLAPLLRSKFGIELEVDLIRRGFNPMGGGIVKLKVRSLPEGRPLPPIDLTEPGTVRFESSHAYGYHR